MSVSGVIELGNTQSKVVSACLSIRLHGVKDAAAFFIRKAIVVIDDVKATVIVGSEFALALQSHPNQLHENQVFILRRRLVSQSVIIERKIAEAQFADVMVAVDAGPNIRY